MTAPMNTRPDRYRNAVIAHIYVEGAAAAIAFYKKAFGAHGLFRVASQDGKIVHGEMAICGSVVMIGDPGDGGLYGEPRKLPSRTLIRQSTNATESRESIWRNPPSDNR
jgi:PhnB protein